MPSIAQLEKLLAIDPDDPFVHYALAQEHANAGDHDQALPYYDSCLERDANYCYAYFHKARSLEAMGRAEDAVATLRTGREHAQRSGDAKALSEIAGYLAELGA